MQMNENRSDGIVNYSNQIDRIKSDLSENIGNKVKFSALNEKKKRVVHSGTIDGIYPSIFVIKVEPDNSDSGTRYISYRYADIITRTVELALCR